MFKKLIILFILFSNVAFAQDVTPPTPTSILDTSATTVNVYFNEDIDSVTGETISNYSVYPAATPAIKYTISSVSVSGSVATVTLVNTLNFDGNLSVDIKNIRDLVGNQMTSGVVITRTISITRKSAELSSIRTLDANTVIFTYNETITDIYSATFQINSNSTYLTVENSILAGTKVIVTLSDDLTEGLNVIGFSTGVIDSDGNVSPLNVQFVTASFEVTDITGPFIKSVTSLTSRTLLVQFDDFIKEQSIETESNWTINNITPSFVYRGEIDSTVVTIDLQSELASGTEYKITVNNATDESNNTFGNTTTYFTTRDIEAPYITNVTIIDDTTLNIDFNETVVASDAVDESNYQIFLSSSNYANDPLNLISAYSLDADTYELKVDQMLDDTNYTIRILNISDASCNFEQSEVSFVSTVTATEIRLDYTNSDNYEITTISRTIVPFDPDSGPPAQSNDISLYNFSLQDENGVAQLAEFFTLSYDSFDSSITELLVVTQITIPAQSTISRYLVWGGAPNLPTYDKLLSTNSTSSRLQIDNNHFKFSALNNQTSPGSDLAFSNSRLAALRQSIYSITINDTEYKSTTSPTIFNYNQRGTVWKDMYSSTVVGPLQLDYVLEIFLESDYLEIKTELSNNTDLAINVSDFRLTWPLFGTNGSIYYKGGSETSFTAGANRGIKIIQDSQKYTILKDATSTLETTYADFNGWVASLSQNGRWYIALIPSNITRQNPRTIGISGTDFYDQFINTSTTINSGETLTFYTTLVLNNAPVPTTRLNRIINSLDFGMFLTDVTEAYKEFTGNSGKGYFYDPPSRNQ